MKTFGEKLKEARKNKKLTQKQLADLINAKHNSISNWENDQNKPDTDMVGFICGALDVTPSQLIGFTLQEETVNLTLEHIESKSDKTQNNNDDIFDIPNIFPIELKKFPLLGNIACGEPIWADEQRENYVMADCDIKADFCLKAQGDSMINARILDGDIIFIKEQPIVDNGEIAAVIIDNEATLKRVYYYKEENLITLMPENPLFKPLRYQGEELDQIRILGKAVYFMSVVK